VLLIVNHSYTTYSNNRQLKISKTKCSKIITATKLWIFSLIIGLLSTLRLSIVVRKGRQKKQVINLCAIFSQKNRRAYLYIQYYIYSIYIYINITPESVAFSSASAKKNNCCGKKTIFEQKKSCKSEILRDRKKPFSNRSTCAACVSMINNLYPLKIYHCVLYCYYYNY